MFHADQELAYRLTDVPLEANNDAKLGGTIFLGVPVDQFWTST